MSIELIGNNFKNEKKTKEMQNINPHLPHYKHDYLYHLFLDTVKDNLKEMFGDVKFICMGGNPKRMLEFACYIKEVIGYRLPTGHTFDNITAPSDRYTMYKIGPVLSVNHGIGCPSMSIVLNELMKLMLHAQCTDVAFFRLGTSGGIGLKPGTIVITDEAVDGMLRSEFKQIVLGEEVRRSTKMNKDLVEEFKTIAKNLQEANESSFENVVSGKTLYTDDFYEGQGRLDGIFCNYDVDKKLSFFQKCIENNVRNIEMESGVFAAFTNYANIKAAIICVTLVDRLNDDQITIEHDLNVKYQKRPFQLIGEYIKKRIPSYNLTIKITV